MLRFQLLVPVLGLLLSLSLGACSQGSDNGGANGNDDDSDSRLSYLDESNYTDTGDLDAIRSHDRLRILIPPETDSRLPRKGKLLNTEQELAAGFARNLDLEPQFLYVDSFEKLIPALQQGKGDIIAANLTITESRKQSIDFTVPVAISFERLVQRKGTPLITSLAQLKGRRIAIRPETSYEETLDRMIKQHPGIHKVLLPGSLDTDQILDRLAQKKFDATIMDDNLVQQAQEYRDDIQPGLKLTGDRPLAWGLRKDSPKLLRELNHYLNQHALTRHPESTYLDDLPGIRKRKVLRVLTRNNAASYFIWRGELLGFEYELARRFARKQGLRLEMIVAPAHEDLIPMLKEGKGDLIASFMTITEARKKQGIRFSRPYHYASEIMVSRDDDTIESPQQLKGRTVVVRKSSSYWQTLKKLKDKGIDFKLEAAPETMETEEIIAKVASGDYDLTVADSHILDIELTWRDDIRADFPLTDPRPDGWGVRKDNPKLLTAINHFIRKEYKGLFYNVIYKKYFSDPHKIKQHREERIDLNPDGTISPYDDLAKKYARKYGFDWRMIVAQMYQESRFDPKAHSWVGAKGLLQVMPRTARELGFKNLEKPAVGLEAGVKYLDWVRDRFEPELNIRDRMWFTLAAYNAGQGHVKDARRLARKLGLDGNRWFNNVEKAMLLLSKRKYARKARHGYVRGREPVNYVRDISNRYRAYSLLASDE